MTQLISSLLTTIDNITDRGDENLLREMITAWRGCAEVRIIREALLHWLETSVDTDKLRAMARETSTHYVWPLHQNNKGYSVAINEFKDPRDIIAGHATTLHNHRYSFISFVLSGGYRQVRSNVELLDSNRVIRIRDLSEDTVTEGDTVTVNHDEFHRLRTITSRTVTLVVKCPAAKGESLSVDTSTLRVTKHVPVEARVGQLMAALVLVNEGGRLGTCKICRTTSIKSG